MKPSTGASVDGLSADRDEEIARWLIDVGKRRRPRSAAAAELSAASPEDLVRYLEGLTERKFRSCEDLLRLFQDFMEENAEAIRAATRRRIVREALLLGALAAAYLHYYYWEVELQIASLHAVKVFVPVTPRTPLLRTQYLFREA